MEKFNGMTTVWGEQNEKYLRSVVLYADYMNDNMYLHTTPECTEESRISGEELYDMYMKNLIKINGTPNLEEYMDPCGIVERDNGGYELLVLTYIEGVANLTFKSKEL